MTVARGMAMGVEGRGGPAAAGCGANGHMTVGRWGGGGGGGERKGRSGGVGRGERRGPARGPTGGPSSPPSIKPVGWPRALKKN